MSWNTATITDAGRALLAGALDANGLRITKARGSGGFCADATKLPTLTKLDAPLWDLKIARAAVKENTLTINLRGSNVGVPEAFTVKQIGLYAENAAGVETLFAVLQDETGERVPAASEQPEYVLDFGVLIPIGSQANVKVEFDPEVLVTALALENRLCNVDYGHFTDADTLEQHAGAALTHTNLTIDGGVIGVEEFHPADAGDHLTDPHAHQNLVVDGSPI